MLIGSFFPQIALNCLAAFAAMFAFLFYHLFIGHFSSWTLALAGI